MAKSLFENKKVLVTGACGTVGSKLVKHLLEDYNVGSLIGLDNNESELFFLSQKYYNFSNAHFFLADVRDQAKLEVKFQGVDIVFHAAAFKHVILCEKSPFEAVQTNIMGVKNVIEASYKCNVSKVIFTSSDKAVNPTNVMGTSKLMGERLMTAANSNRSGEGPIFASTRFGNVLGSRGSVIPIFREQIRNKGPVTLTDADMTRFIMSISQATKLVIDSALLAKGGEVFVTKMPVIKICDLASVMINRLGPKYGFDPNDIKIELIGSKPGEKLYEELMSVEETRRTIELEKYFSVLPAFKNIYKEISYNYPNVISNKIDNPYNSSNERPLSEKELEDFLIHYQLLDETPEKMEHPKERFWPNGK